MKKPLIIGVAIVAVAAIAFFGFMQKPAEEEVAGTIGAAARHDASPTTDEDIVLGNEEFAHIYQSDVFQRVMEDPDLIEVLNDPEFAKLAADPRFAAMAGNPDFAKLAADPRFADTAGNPDFAVMAKDPRFSRLAASPRFAKLAADPDFARIVDNPGLWVAISGPDGFSFVSLGGSAVPRRFRTKQGTISGSGERNALTPERN